MWGDRCREGVLRSIGSVGNSTDNAITESFFASLECELLDGRSFEFKAEACMALFAWIELVGTTRGACTPPGATSGAELRAQS